MMTNMKGARETRRVRLVRKIIGKVKMMMRSKDMVENKITVTKSWKKGGKVMKKRGLEISITGRSKRERERK